MNVYIHLGVHKTASTLLQKSMQVNQTTFTDVTCIIRDTHPIIKNHLRQYLSGNKTLAQVSKHLQQVTSHDSLEQTLLISDENLLGPPVSVLVKRGEKSVFYPDINQRIQRLDALFASHTVNYLVYTRQQESLILSLYLDGLKYFRYDISLEAFYAKCMDSNLRFDIMLESLDIDRCIIKPFESIKQGSQQFVKQFWNAVGVNQSINPTPSEQLNPAISAIQADICRAIARQSYNQEEKTQLRKWLRTMPNLPTNASKVVLSQSQIDNIRDHYKDDITYR